MDRSSDGNNESLKHDHNWKRLTVANKLFTEREHNGGIGAMEQVLIWMLILRYIQPGPL